jgi:hypothetical protein
MALLIALVSLTFLGCSGSRSSAARNSPAQRIGARTNATAVSVSPATTAPATGRVARVNPDGAFVILSYPLGAVPPVGRRLSVYRDGMKVGELKVSEPRYQQHTAADITAGEARAGDETREN